MKSIFGIKKSRLKRERGSASILALFTVLVFAVILTGIYMIVTTRQKSQLKSDMRIQEIYSDDVNNVDMIYEVQKAIREGKYNTLKNVNSPTLLTGMEPIEFTMPTETVMGQVSTQVDEDWYDYGTTYETRRWANAQTEDGSMWVWIPRYAYKITYTNKDDKAQGGKIDIKFLIGKSDYYYDDKGNIKVAKRCNSEDELVDTTLDYVVHPAFTDESNINFRNGGWDEELTGIWVAKFEAGYASGNNDANVVESNVNYTQNTAVVSSIEAGTDADSGQTARNWLDGEYSVKNGTIYEWKNGTQTAIKYPVFQPLTYSMNYINNNDTYLLSKSLTDYGNIYGLENTDADSHLMKNSEWGAVAYLTQSIYGQDGKEVTINNANLNNSVTSVYAVTGCTSNTTNTVQNLTTIDEIKKVSGNTPTSKTDELTGGIYVWNQLTGQNASTSGTIYGIYDLSGAMWEKTSSYIANGNSVLKDRGNSMTYENEILKTTSTKYTTVYPYSSPESTILDTASQNNFVSNTKIYGDAVKETTGNNAGTSNTGWGGSSWNEDYSIYAGLHQPFLVRGGDFRRGTRAGLYAFSYNNAASGYYIGFRAVLAPIYDESEEEVQPQIITGPRAGGSYDNPYIPTGFTHTQGNGTWNSGFTIKEASTGNEFVWVPCVTDESQIKSGDKVATFGKTLPSTTATTDPYYMYNQKNFVITGDENPANDIKTSVGKYGGFYIAKYEAGVPVDANGNEIAATTAVATQKVRSVANATLWNNITRENAVLASENMVNTTDGVKSGLISGECWDTTLKWMVNTSDNAANEPNLGYDIDSSGNGWYGQDNRATTGKYPINNIYDMAGNVYEWTTENCTYYGSTHLVYRGGRYDYSGADYPAASRSTYNLSSDNNIGFRVVLYKTEPSYDNPYIPTGFAHTEGTWNSGYTIKETATGNEFVWVPCVTDASKIKSGDKVAIFGKTLPSTTETTDPYYKYNQFNLTITGDENPASDIKTSVGKYGGFYIAKYEAGVPVDSNNNEIDVASATVTQKARSVANATVWTNISRTNSIKAAENMIDNTLGVKSGLISGECWDTTLQWMVNTSDNATENVGYDIDSTGNGWYKDVANGQKTTTGKYPINNIYDIAGNVWELSTENCKNGDNKFVVIRGGYFGDLSSTYPTACRYNIVEYSTSNVGFRVVLYK